MTCDRSVWLSVVRQNRHLPLPSYLHSPSLLVETPTTSLESAIRSAHKVSKSWLLPRATNIHPAAENLHPTPGQHLILLEIFSDRWLLCVYAEGSVSLWDLDSESTSIDGQHVPAKPGYKFDRIGRDIGEENGWTSCVAALDVDEQAIMLACCRMTRYVANSYNYSSNKTQLTPCQARTLHQLRFTAFLFQILLQAEGTYITKPFRQSLSLQNCRTRPV